MMVKAGKVDEVVGLTQEWDRERRPKIKVAGPGYIFQMDSDPNELNLVAIFDDHETYEANADDQEWNDGEILSGG